MREIPYAELQFDFSLYPRMDVNTAHVTSLVMAIEAGANLPPVVIDKKTKRIIDGFHRARALYRIYKEKAKIPCIEKDYQSDAEMFLDAVRCNAGHGQKLAPYDRTHCVILADQFGLEVEQIAEAMSMTREAVGSLKAGRIGRLRGPNEVAIPIKTSVKHMAGRKMSKAQVEAHSKLLGHEQPMLINQIIILIESNLLDTSSEKVMAKIKRLKELIDGIVN